jgi:hypothetical protein
MLAIDPLSVIKILDRLDSVLDHEKYVSIGMCLPVLQDSDFM